MISPEVECFTAMTPTGHPTQLPPFRCRERTVAIGGEPLLVGILNLTPDSFYDGGRFAPLESAISHAERMVAEGAALIDVGGQSTRPGHEEVSAEAEIARVVPVITALVKRLAIPLSIDTYKPEVARAALRAGAHVLNDIYGLQRDPQIAQVASDLGAPLIVMHHDLSFREKTVDPLPGIIAFFNHSLTIAARAGIARDQVILDPGIGFAKTAEQNLEILGRLSELKVFGCPLLVGASRKSVIGHVLSLPPEDRLEGTLATTTVAVWQGVDFIRVHDVQANLRAARVAYAIRQSSHS